MARYWVLVRNHITNKRITGVQQSQGQMRNESINATEIFSNFIQIATMKKEMKRVKTIEQERLEET